MSANLKGSAEPITITVRLSGAVLYQGDNYIDKDGNLFIVDFYDPDTGELVLIPVAG